MAGAPRLVASLVPRWCQAKAKCEDLKSQLDAAEEVACDKEVQSAWETLTGWWFQKCFIFHNIWDNPSH